MHCTCIGFLWHLFALYVFCKKQITKLCNKTFHLFHYNLDSSNHYLRRPKRVSSGSKFINGRLWVNGEAEAGSFDITERDTRDGVCTHILFTCEKYVKFDTVLAVFQLQKQLMRQTLKLPPHSANCLADGLFLALVGLFGFDDNRIYITKRDIVGFVRDTGCGLSIIITLHRPSENKKGTRSPSHAVKCYCFYTGRHNNKAPLPRWVGKIIETCHSFRCNKNANA